MATRTTVVGASVVSAAVASGGTYIVAAEDPAPVVEPIAHTVEIMGKNEHKYLAGDARILLFHDYADKERVVPVVLNSGIRRLVRCEDIWEVMEDADGTTLILLRGSWTGIKAPFEDMYLMMIGQHGPWRQVVP